MMKRRTLIKGITVTITSTIYRDFEKTIIADLTGALVYFMVKKRPDDLDAAALITKSVGSGISLSASFGKAFIRIDASDTKDLFIKKIYHETVAILADGTVIRNGINEVELLGNVRRSIV